MINSSTQDPPAPQVQVTIGKETRHARFFVTDLFAIEDRLGQGLPAIFDSVRELVAVPDTLDGVEIPRERLSDLTPEERARMTTSDRARTRAMARLRLGPVASFVAACVRMSRDELMAAASGREVLDAASILIPAFMQAFVQMYAPTEDVEPGTDEGKAVAQSATDSRPGPASNSERRPKNSPVGLPPSSESSAEPGSIASADPTTAPA